MTHYTILLIAALACGMTKDGPPAPQGPVAPTKSSTPQDSAKPMTAGDAVVMVPHDWECKAETFQPSDRLIALTGGAVIRPGEAGHELTCFLEGPTNGGAAYVFRYTIGDSMKPEERFQADLDETYASPLTLTREGTTLGKPVTKETSGCSGLLVEHQVIAFEAPNHRRHFLCSRNGVAYNVVVSGTEGKAWTEAQAILDSLTFQ